jgi:hypothetical protein
MKPVQSFGSNVCLYPHFLLTGNIKIVKRIFIFYKIRICMISVCIIPLDHYILSLLGKEAGIA